LDGDDRFVRINGYRLRYRLRGRGPLVVFGHGLLGTMEQVDEHAPGIDDLLERARLLTFDARGHGASEGPADPGEYTWETLGRDMGALAAHAGDERAVFGGGSMGAASALWVAIEQPERVRGLILVMPPPLGHPEMRGPGEHKALAFLEMLGTAVEQLGVERTVELARQMPGFAGTEEQADRHASWLLAQSPLALTHAIRGLLRSPYHDPEDYRRITAPALVIAHAGDDLHPVRSAELLAERLRDCRLVVGPHPGYWRENREGFRRAIMEFMNQL